jgi:hypothetical protein
MSKVTVGVWFNQSMADKGLWAGAAVAAKKTAADT